MTYHAFSGSPLRTPPAAVTAPPQASGDRFRKILSHTIHRLDETLSRDQLSLLADAFTVICWEFPDVDVRVWLAVDREPPRIRVEPEYCRESGVTVRMDAAVLEAAAAGKTSLAAAFLTGRLQLRGLNPLFLTKFVMLIDPLLSSFRASVEADHGQPT